MISRKFGIIYGGGGLGLSQTRQSWGGLFSQSDATCTCFRRMRTARASGLRVVGLCVCCFVSDIETSIETLPI